MRSIAKSGVSSVLALASLLALAGCAKSGKVVDVQQPTPTSTPAQAKLQVEGPKEWVRSEKTDQMDGHKKVTLTLLSSNKLRYGMDGEGTAQISLECDKEVFLALQPGSSSTLVRYKFDEAAPVPESWFGDNDSLLTSIQSDRLGRLMRARTLKIEFTPPRSTTQIAVFELGDLKQLIQREKACDFRKKAHTFE